VEGSTHRQVVELIKAGGDKLTMKIISVPARDAPRLDPDDDFFYDYTDVKKVDVSVPSFEHVEENGSRYVVRVLERGEVLCASQQAFLNKKCFFFVFALLKVTRVKQEDLKNFPV